MMRASSGPRARLRVVDLHTCCPVRQTGSPRLLLEWTASRPHLFSLYQHNVTILRQGHRKCITLSIPAIFAGIFAAFEVSFLKFLRLHL